MIHGVCRVSLYNLFVFSTFCHLTLRICVVTIDSIENKNKNIQNKAMMVYRNVMKVVGNEPIMMKKRNGHVIVITWIHDVLLCYRAHIVGNVDIDT
jgi:hypothetical protein